MTEEKNIDYFQNAEEEVQKKVTAEIEKKVVQNKNTQVAIEVLRGLVSTEMKNTLKDELRANMTGIDEKMLEVEAQIQIDTHVLLPIAQKLLQKVNKNE